MGWIRRHWLALLGVLPLLPPIIKWAFWALSRGGDADFIISRLDEPAWVGQLMQWLLNPPASSLVPMIVIGLALIYLDVRRNRRGGTTEEDGVARDAGLPDNSQLRELVTSSYRMVDEIERQYATTGHAPNHEIRRAILRRSEYHQLEPHLTEDTRLNIQQPSGISLSPAVTIAGEETDTERLLRMIRSDIAAIERDWGIAPAKRGQPATPAPPSP